MAGINNANGFSSSNGLKKSEVMRVPDKRQNRDKWPAAAFVNFLLIMVIAVYFNTFNQDCAFLRTLTSHRMEDLDRRFFLDMLATMLLGHMFAEHLRRLCLFWEEWYHLETRYYKKSKKSALLTCLSLNQRSALVSAVISLICLSVVCLGPYGFHFLILIPFYSVAYLCLHMFGVWRPRDADLQKLSDSTMNFGTAFAWQYYLGYLQIVLPGFLDRVAAYEKEAGVPIRIHKLFLLLPESCYMPPLLSSHEADVDTLEHVCNLELSVDRNGAKNRIYKNPVYRVSPTGLKPFFCCVESVAILNSLNDMCERETLTGVTEQKKFEQLQIFCSSLKKILEENEDGLGDLVQLVYYQDIDADGNKVKIADVLKRHVGVALQQM